MMTSCLAFFATLTKSITPLNLRFSFARAFACASVFLLFSCAVKPTAVKETPERKNQAPNSEPTAVQITPDTVIVDARPAFEYSTGHVPKSFPLQWTDFTEPVAAQKGVLQADLFAIARRLARIGIQPSTKVVVLGAGLKGGGEEGRVAWMLNYLGVRDARFAEQSIFKGHLTTVETEPYLNVPMWKPQPNELLNVTRAELQFVLNSGGVNKPVQFAKFDRAFRYQIIDVRPAKDYLGQEGFGASHALPNMEAINIPWHEFFDASLKPKREIATQLKAIGISPDRRLIVLDHSGVASAAVTLALRSLGYENTGNYSGGLTDLLSAYKKPKAAKGE
jgi:thiosulfate/3-mercaptopyruvate sulfurtransferase